MRPYVKLLTEITCCCCVQRLTFNLLWLSFVILLGMSFQFGYNIGVLNQPVQVTRS